MNFLTIALTLHVLVCAMIIGLVLFQRGKGAEAGAAFGAGASGTVFGAKGSANFLTRATGIAATLFYLSSLGLTYLATNRPVAESLMDDAAAPGIEIRRTGPAEDEEIEELPGLPGLDAPLEEERPGQGSEN